MPTHKPKTKSSYVLVKFQDNWADEMDVAGFRVMERSEYEIWKKGWKGLFPTGEIYVGTNECLMYPNKKSYEETIETLDINETDAEVLIRCFGGRKWGEFVDIVERCGTLKCPKCGNESSYEDIEDGQCAECWLKEDTN